MKKIRVLVADDHPFFRAGICQWIDQQPNLICCGQAGSSPGTRAKVADLEPDVLLLDLRLDELDGMELISELSGRHPLVRIIIISQCDECVYAHRALNAGARGYIMKSEATETAAEAILTVLAGEVFLCRHASARILHNLYPDPSIGQRDLRHLSDRELQVFQLLGSGQPPRKIAESLGISPKTVDTYREHIKNKLNFGDGAVLLRAATMWVENGRLG